MTKWIVHSEWWMPRVVWLWGAITLLFGLLTQQDPLSTFIYPCLAVALAYLAAALLRWLFVFQSSTTQRVTPFISRTITAFWVLGIIGFLQLLAIALFEGFRSGAFNYFLIAISVFPVGTSMGAAREWRRVRQLQIRNTIS
ncbi:hypothetical protein [Spongiibacter marinus]|uniref:hypothetical protein n=1 Tax=Spongiibacter marinus TaxID=354246 RepID=UPI003566F49D